MTGVLRIVVACAFVVSFAAGAVGAGDAQAQYRLKIESQPLGTALQEFAKQSGIQIIFFSRLAEGREARALEGSYTLTAALEYLLAGSNLTFEVINDRAIEIRPPPAVADTRKKAEKRLTRSNKRSTVALPPTLEEVVVVGLAEQLVATRVPTPLRDIPQTISIVSPEQLRQQNATDLADVLRRAPGITTTRTSSLNQDFFSRGYEIASFHVDGGAALNPAVDPSLLPLVTPDMSEFDRVEVLRGSDALFGGNGNPGGTVSLVRKRPRPDFDVSVSASAGSWDNYRVEADITGPLTADGALRGRLDGVYSQRNFFYNTADFERRRIFGALEYDFTPTATLTVGGSYQTDHAVPFMNGLPLYANGDDPRLSRDTALTFDWASYWAHVTEGYVQYRQELGDAWTLKVNTAGWQVKAEYGYGEFSGLIDPATRGVGQLNSIFTPRPNVHTHLTGDVTLTGEFDWFGWREELAVGGDYTHLEYKLQLSSGTATGMSLPDIYTFDPSSYPDPRLQPAGSLLTLLGRANIDQYGAFASMRVYFNDAWSAVGGARTGSDHSEREVRLKFNDVLFPGRITTNPGNTNVITPYVGVIYNINDRYSVYASYADIYLTTGVRERRDGSDLGAARGATSELGIKGAWGGGALNGALVLYSIAQHNVPISAPVPPNTISVICCWVGGTTRSRGVDLEISGELAPGWLIGAGYTYNENEDPDGDPLSTITPKHLLKVWTSKQLPGAFDRWTVGGNLHAQSRTLSGINTYCATGVCTDFYVVEEPYAVVDLRAAYQIDPQWEVSLSVNNVLDKNYYESIGSPAMHTWYGEPRSVMLRMDGRY